MAHGVLMENSTLVKILLKMCIAYKVKKSKVLNETPSQSYGMSLAIWDHCHVTL